MFKSKLIWQLFYTYIFIISISIFAASWNAYNYIRLRYLDFVKESLESVAKIVGNTIEEENILFEQADLDDLCKELSAIYNKRLTIILPNGVVIGESDTDLAEMENHANRPEIKDALHGKVGDSMRYSVSVDKTMQYVAIPYRQDGEIIGVIRASYPASSIDVVFKSIFIQIGLDGGLIALIAICISLYFSFSISYPLKLMQQGAARFAHGDLHQPIQIKGVKDFEVLSDAMNNMAVQLDERIHNEVQQRSQQEAILSSMVEGVIAVNKKKEVISMNQTARSWLELNESEVDKSFPMQRIQNPSIIEYINRALQSPKSMELEIELGTYNMRFVQAQSSSLRDTDGSITGTVIVMHDVTRIRTLENMRQEFVANVSHELKTPITSIKGFVETLMDGALQNTEDTERFLTIITKQADRLHAIIEDLLSLSRIEQEEKQGSIPLESKELAVVLKSAMENCLPRLEEKHITFLKEIDETIQAEINAQLLEQAVMNLIDNAVKYSENGSSIKVMVNANEVEAVIHVQDWGCGISPEHIPRLFERFYRVDKARSRKLGGTGLGLAIVKHITQAHGGYVDVESEVGFGSIFKIHLPKQH